MNSPYDTIESYWPRRRGSVRHPRRRATPGPSPGHQPTARRQPRPARPRHDPAPPPPDEIIDVDAVISRARDPRRYTWDGILDALDPVRGLIAGPDALIPPATYQEHSTTSARGHLPSGPVAATTPWAFLAIAGTQHGAPHWILLEADPRRELHQLDDVVTRLRELLAENPANRAFDDTRRPAATGLRRPRLPDGGPAPPPPAHQARNQMTPPHRCVAQDTPSATAARAWRNGGNNSPPSPARPPAPPGPTPTPSAKPGSTWSSPTSPNTSGPATPGWSDYATSQPASNTTPCPSTMVEQAMTGIPQVPDIDTRIAACILGVPQLPPAT